MYNMLDVVAVIRLLKHDWYSSEVFKPIDNLDVTYSIFQFAKTDQVMQWLNNSASSILKRLLLA